MYMFLCSTNPCNEKRLGRKHKEKFIQEMEQ